MTRPKSIIFLFLLSSILFSGPQKNQKVAAVFSADSMVENVVDDSSFVVFDGTSFRDKPDLTQYGLKPISIIYASRLWENTSHGLEGTESLPSVELLVKQAIQARQENDIAVIDIEHWSVKGDKKKVRESIERYIEVFELFKNATPDVRYGYYGIPPIANYWNAIRGETSSRYQKWADNNRRLGDLAQKVDVFYPSLYTYYQDRERWVRYAIENIKQARKYNVDKPVYVFLWPQFHGYNKKLKGQFVDPEFWEIQLKTARKYADGIVIWTPYRLRWDNSAEWWTVTKKFMEGLDNK